MSENTIKPQDFTYNTPVVTKEQFDAHIKLYHGYVDKVNEIGKILNENPEADTANATYSHFRCLKKGQSYALDGVVLHELYFNNMGGAENTPWGASAQVLEAFFGSYADWARDFKASALSARGWAMLAFDQRTAAFHNLIADTHDDGIVTGAFPVLVLDMYEHAYFLDYQTDKAAYIDKFIKCVNWEVVDSRVKKTPAAG